MLTWTSTQRSQPPVHAPRPVAATHIVEPVDHLRDPVSATGLNSSGDTSPRIGSCHRINASALVTPCPSPDTIGCRCNSIRPASIACVTSFDEIHRVSRRSVGDS